MIYKACLGKAKTYWWDENTNGCFQFVAADDDNARSHVATIVQRMNRRYDRMKEPRGISLAALCRMAEVDGKLVEQPVLITGDEKPFPDFRSIRKVLECFYPREPGDGRDSVMRLFDSWRPLPARQLG